MLSSQKTFTNPNSLRAPCLFGRNLKFLRYGASLGTKYLKRFLIFGFTLFVLSACSQKLRPNQALYERLSGRGPLALSPVNPFLAANVLVSKEIENSLELRGFVQHRGGPNAIELEQSFFGDLQMIFYYSEPKESFILDNVAGSWIIRGPYPIPTPKLADISKISHSFKGPPALGDLAESDKTNSPQGFDAFSKRQEFPQANAGFKSPTPTNVQLDSPKPKSESKLASSSQREDGGLAEISPKGDLVHYVTSNKESLQDITLWYTGDINNLSRLSRLNGLNLNQALEPGDQLIIPSYMLRNKRRMPAK